MEIKMYDNELFAAIKYTIITGVAAVFGMIKASSISFILGGITVQGFISALQPFSYLVTICAGFMAIRHWYYATKKINKEK